MYIHIQHHTGIPFGKTLNITMSNNNDSFSTDVAFGCLIYIIYVKEMVVDLKKMVVDFRRNNGGSAVEVVSSSDVTRSILTREA